MSPTFIYPLVSRKVTQISIMRLNIFFLSFLFICPSNSYSQSLSAEQIYKKVSDAVIVIHAYNDNDELAMQGSGVVLNDKGYVVTNYHVLSGNKRIEILHGKKIIPYVDIIGVDVEKDILILKIEAKKFPAVKIGNSNSLKIGQRIYAIGSPMGLENSISEGIISGFRNYNEAKRNFIQITASISPGSSGGAIVNDKGELIGISTLTVKEGQNLNFAIPIEDVLKVEIGSYSKNDKYKDFNLFKKGYDATEKGDYQEGIKYYSLYINKHPKDASAFNNRGSAKDNLDDYAGAIQDYNIALGLNPNLEESYVGRGTSKSKLKDYRSAIQDYNKAIELNPNDDAAYYNRGLTKSNLDDYRSAIQDYNKAIELNPNLTIAFYNRANAKSKLEDYRGAIPDFNKAIELNPNDAGVYMRRGVAKSKLDDSRGAIQDYSNAIELNPNDALAYYGIGYAKSDLKDYRGAIQDYSKAIELYPNYENAYNNRGVAKSKLEDYRSAIQDFNKAIELYSNDADAYSNRGRAKYFLGDKYGACNDWSKAGELGSAEAYGLIRAFCK